MQITDLGLPKLYSIYGMRGEEYLICYSTEDRIRLQARTTRHVLTHTLEKFRELVRSGELVLMNEAGLPAIHSVAHSLSETQRQRFDRRCHYVNAVMAEHSGRLSRAHFDVVIQKAASIINDEDPPTYSTVARWLNSFKSRGEINLPLIDRHAYINKRADRTNTLVDKIISVVIDEVLLKPECVRESYVYELIKAKVYEQNELLGKDDYLSVPSLNTVRNRIDRIDVMHKIERRQGRFAALRLNQYGRKILVEDYIGSRVEMDSNHLDVFVWDDFLKVAVRPLLTLVLDVPSRCVLGWELSLNTISAAKTMGALRDAMSRDEFCETRAIPYQLYIDGGCEFANESLEVSCDVLGITVLKCSPKSPNQKPHVERIFKTLNDGFFHNLPGTTKSNPRHRGDYESEDRATFNMDALRSLFRKYIHEVYHHTTHDALGMTPLDKWREMAKHRPPRVLSGGEADHCFLIPKMVSINKGRVQAFNLQWTGPGLPTLQERLSRSREKSKVKLLIDPDQIGTAYVIDPTNTTAPQAVRCVEDERFHKISLRQWKWICDRARSNAKASTLADPFRLSRTVLEIQREIAEATRTDKAKGERKRAARKNAAKFAEINIAPASVSPGTAMIAAVAKSKNVEAVPALALSGLVTLDPVIAKPSINESSSGALANEPGALLLASGLGDTSFESPAHASSSPEGQAVPGLNEANGNSVSSDALQELPLFSSTVYLRKKND